MNAVFLTARTGDFCFDIAMVLKEVQVLPGKNFKVMSLRSFTALGAWIETTAFSTYIEYQLIGFLCCIEMLINYFPRCLQAEAEHKYLITIHG